MSSNREWVITLREDEESKTEAICSKLKSLGFHVERAEGQFILGNGEAALHDTLASLEGVLAVEDNGEATIARNRDSTP